MFSPAPLHLNSLQSSRDCCWTIQPGIDRQSEHAYISLSVGPHRPHHDRPGLNDRFFGYNAVLDTSVRCRVPEQITFSRSHLEP